MLNRRQFGAVAAGIVGTFAILRPGLAAMEDDPAANLQRALKSIEQSSGGGLGVAILDAATGLQGQLNGDERFPMCSTFKFLAAAAVLKRVDGGQSRLDARILYKADDVVANSPATKEHVEGGMSIGELCEAALTLSDNTAGNMLLREIGGPAALTSFARSLGDSVTRLDRWEVELNEALPGDPRDTTTPSAMLRNLHEIITGNVLSEKSREQLKLWMVSNKTGDARLRAGLPRDWKVADKTGAGERGTTNDIGVLWPPGREPAFVTVYLTGSSASPDSRNATIAKVATVTAAAISAHRS